MYICSLQSWELASMDRARLKCFLQRKMEGICISMVEMGDDGKYIRLKERTQQFTWHKTESKHYTVGFMCILHLLYFSPHLLIAKSENTLDTFSNLIRIFLEDSGNIRRNNYKSLSEKTDWYLQVATPPKCTQFLSKLNLTHIFSRIFILSY